MNQRDFEYFTTEDTVIMLVDHQVGTLGWVKSRPQETVVTNCRVLAKMALAYDMPLILTTTVEDQVGSTIPDIQEVAPDAYAKRYKRDGRLSCWDDEALAAGVKALGRKNVVLAGLTTDICLFWAAVDAKNLGYRVMVVADACGTMTALGDSLTFDRLTSLGIQVAVINQVVTELANDFSTAEGQKAQQIMGVEIISKLYATPSS
jgi:nicotinamidase-related amidase